MSYLYCTWSTNVYYCVYILSWLHFKIDVILRERDKKWLLSFLSHASCHFGFRVHFLWILSTPYFHALCLKKISLRKPWAWGGLFSPNFHSNSINHLCVTIRKNSLKMQLTTFHFQESYIRYIFCNTYHLCLLHLITLIVLDVIKLWEFKRCDLVHIPIRFQIKHNKLYNYSDFCDNFSLVKFVTEKRNRVIVLSMLQVTRTGLWLRKCNVWDIIFI